MNRWIAFCATSLLACSMSLAASPDSGAGRIRPWGENPRYWQYKGQPVLLLGGSKDDNLFQIPELREHLDEMRAAGGNYIRNTMSDRQDHDFEVYPFKRLPNGKYDLEQWNEEYWRRFENLLRWTAERDIIVQIEVWDRFDYSTRNWPPHPYNPKNNVNYTYEQSGFAPEYPDHPGANRQPFFFTTPKQRNNQIVYQETVRGQDALPHTQVRPRALLHGQRDQRRGGVGGPSWAEQHQATGRRDGQAGLRDRDVGRLEPPGRAAPADIRPPGVVRDFADVSQNNHQKGPDALGQLPVGPPIYRLPAAANQHGQDLRGGHRRYGTMQDGLERVWRHIIGGRRRPGFRLARLRPSGPSDIAQRTCGACGRSTGSTSSRRPDAGQWFIA